MSWSKFNDSLNSLKGQISTFVQETLIPEDEDIPEPTERQIQIQDVGLEQLQEICTEQESEIVALRRQVADLQSSQSALKQPTAPTQQQPQQQNAPTEGGSGSSAGIGAGPSGGPASTVSQTLEDSWFWETDKHSSSSGSSSKTGSNDPPVIISKSASGADLTNIPLGQQQEQQQQEPQCSTEPEKNSSGQELAEKEVQLKKLSLENAVLREKNHQLQMEVRETNVNIEELDKQHNLIMETILEQKKTLQVNYDETKSERDKLAMKLKQMADAKDARIVELQQENEVLERRQLEMSGELAELKDKVREEPFVEVVEEEKDTKLEDELKTKAIELENLRVEKRKVEEDFVAGQEDYLQVQREFAEYKQRFNEDELKETLEGLEKDLSELRGQLEKSVAERKRAEHERETLQADLINYEIECGELLKNNEKLLEELEQTKCGKLETIPEHSEESFTVLEGEYSEVSAKCKEMEAQVEELKSDRSRLEEQVQQLEFQLNELRSTEEEGEKEKEDGKVENDRQLQVLKELEEKLEKSENCRNQLEINLTQSKQSLETSNKQLQLIESELVELKDQHQQLLTQSNAEREQQQQQLSDDRDQLTTDYQKLQLENENYASVVKQLTDEKQRLEEVAAQLKVDFEEKAAALEEQLRAAIKNDDAAAAESESAAIEVAEMKMAAEKQVQEIVQLNEVLGQLNQEKANLIALVTQKHQESVQYHGEVQRLGGLLHQLEGRDCEKCVQMRELEDRLDALQKGESEQVHFLKEKAGILTSNLLVEQNMKKLAQKEKEDVERDLERLRQHLMSLEEEHTTQLIDLQRQMEEYRTKSTALESEAKHASTTYTSASIRANQQNETLQAQYKLLQQQRDDLSAKLSHAEDRESKNAAALVNLQCALEQFQNEKQRDIENSLYLVRKEVLEEKQKFSNLLTELQATQVQLSEAKSGLLAAARISDQLESSQKLMADQKEEIRSWEAKVAKLEEKMRQSAESESDKVEKGLIKNMVIGYLTAPNNGRGQILKLLSAVLDFTPAEAEKTGVNRSNSGWLGGLLHSSGGGGAGQSDEGLAQAFVKFLEQESRPGAGDSGAALLNIMNTGGTGGASSSRKTSVVTAAEQSGLATAAPVGVTLLPQPTLMRMEEQSFVPTRNSSSILKDVLNDS